MTRAVQIAELGDQNVFTVDGDNTRVGIGSTQPTVKLDVTGDGNVSGTLTATSFSGDGTGLTGVASTDNIITGTAATFTNNVNISGITTVGVLTATQINVTGVLTATQVNATGLTGTPDITIQNVTGVAGTFTGFVAFSTSISVGGTITYEDVTNVDSIGIVTARSGIQIPNDSGKLRAGTDLELQVFHDGTNSVIKDTRNSGKVRVQADNFDIIDKDASETMLSATVDGAVSLNYNGSTKLATNNTGVTVTGTVAATSYTGDGSNLTGISAGITTTKYSPTANAIIQIGLGTAQHHELTLSAGFTTITTSGGSFGESHSLVLIQPSSGIATVGFSTFFQFPSGATPSMSEGSSKVDLVSFVVKDIAGNTGTGATELLASAGLNYN